MGKGVCAGLGVDGRCRLIAANGVSGRPQSFCCHNGHRSASRLPAARYCHPSLLASPPYAGALARGARQPRLLRFSARLQHHRRLPQLAAAPGAGLMLVADAAVGQPGCPPLAVMAGGVAGHSLMHYSAWAVSAPHSAAQHFARQPGPPLALRTLVHSQDRRGQVGSRGRNLRPCGFEQGQGLARLLLFIAACSPGLHTCPAKMTLIKTAHCLAGWRSFSSTLLHLSSATTRTAGRTTSAGGCALVRHRAIANLSHDFQEVTAPADIHCSGDGWETSH